METYSSLDSLLLDSCIDAEVLEHTGHALGNPADDPAEQIGSVYQFSPSALNASS